MSHVFVIGCIAEIVTTARVITEGRRCMDSDRLFFLRVVPHLRVGFTGAVWRDVRAVLCPASAVSETGRETSWAAFCSSAAILW